MIANFDGGGGSYSTTDTSSDSDSSTSYSTTTTSYQDAVSDSWGYDRTGGGGSSGTAGDVKETADTVDYVSPDKKASSGGTRTTTTTTTTDTSTSDDTMTHTDYVMDRASDGPGGTMGSVDARETVARITGATNTELLGDFAEIDGPSGLLEDAQENIRDATTNFTALSTGAMLAVVALVVGLLAAVAGGN